MKTDLDRFDNVAHTLALDARRAEHDHGCSIGNDASYAADVIRSLTRTLRRERAARKRIEAERDQLRGVSE